MKVAASPFNPDCATPNEWTNSRKVKQVGGYVLLSDLSQEEIEALKVLGRLFRFNSPDLSFRLIFKEPQVIPGMEDKGEFGSIGWKVAQGSFTYFEAGGTDLGRAEADDLEGRIKEIQ